MSAAPPCRRRSSLMPTTEMTSSPAPAGQQARRWRRPPRGVLQARVLASAVDGRRRVPGLRATAVAVAAAGATTADPGRKAAPGGEEEGPRPRDVAPGVARVRARARVAARVVVRVVVEGVVGGVGVVAADAIGAGETVATGAMVAGEMAEAAVVVAAADHHPRAGAGPKGGTRVVTKAKAGIRGEAGIRDEARGVAPARAKVRGQAAGRTARPAGQAVRMAQVRRPVQTAAVRRVRVARIDPPSRPPRSLRRRRDGPRARVHRQPLAIVTDAGAPR